MIVGITRIRNEALILEDTLLHFLARCDRIVIYDDCSTDESVEIARSFEAVSVIEGRRWESDQWRAETRHRAKCLDAAKGADMVLCFDADERLCGELPEAGGGWRFALYDGYLTPDYCEPYRDGRLQDLPRMWGPERRDILMYFDPRPARYERPGSREPQFDGEIRQADVKVRHYGKCLSIEHWEETCDFYVRCFPQWAEKWRRRKGKAIHTASDFGQPLVEWEALP